MYLDLQHCQIYRGTVTYLDPPHCFSCSVVNLFGYTGNELPSLLTLSSSSDDVRVEAGWLDLLVLRDRRDSLVRVVAATRRLRLVWTASRTKSISVLRSDT